MLGRRDDRGSTSSLGIAIAAATFAGGFFVAQVMVAEPGGIDPRSATLEAEASTGLDLIVRDGGRAATGVGWAAAPDLMTRFGLALDGGPNFLDYEKVRALRNGTPASAMNGAPDYPDVRAALGVRDGDFHLRSYPVMPGYDDPRWVKEQNGRVAYVARYSGASAPATVTSSATKTTTELNVTVTVRNDAAKSAIFTVSIGLGNQAAGSSWVTEDRHTRLLAPGESQSVWAVFHRLPTWDASITGVKVDVMDPYGSPAVTTAGVPVGPFWIAQTPPVGGSSTHNLLLSAAKVYAVTGSSVKFNADHYKSAGGHVSGTAPTARFVLVGPNGKEWTNQSVTLPTAKNKVYTYTCANCTVVGNYTAVLWDSAMQRRHMDVLHVSALPMFTEKRTLDPVALREMAILDGLVASFDPTRYDETTAPQGDVFGDDTNGPSDIVGVLPRYTTLVVGSEVTQTALNAAATKHAIADWVQDGGNLIVLGTHNQQSRWLEPIYHAAQVTANGGISAPDPMHPILSAPNRLAYDQYLDRARAWDIKTDQPFTHILTRGETGTSREDTLAVSAPGAFNDGTVVLTSYMPGALTSPQDDAEAARLLHNLLSQSYTMLFLDYGPPIPDSVPVGSAQRLVAVPHPNVPGAVVEVRLVMYRFG